MSTLILQPDGTVGQDTYLFQPNATTNFGDSVALIVGEGSGGLNFVYHSLLKFTELNQVPSNAVVDAATLYLKLRTQPDGADLSVDFRRLKRAWVELEATWNIWKTANNWAGAGATHVDDRDSLVWANQVIQATDPVGTEYAISLPVVEVQKWVDGTNPNEGLIFQDQTELNSVCTIYSSDETVASNRPKLVITYRAAGPEINFYRRRRRHPTRR